MNVTFEMLDELALRRESTTRTMYLPKGIRRSRQSIIPMLAKAHSIENTIRVDEKNEEVVVPLKVFGVDPIDKLEGGLLAMSLSSVGKSRNCNASRAVGDIDTFRVGLKRERNTKLLDGVEI